MSDQKANQFQYQSFNTNENQNPGQNPQTSDYPITPPPYTPYPDQNSYLPNAPNNEFERPPIPVMFQPTPGSVPINSSDMFRTNYGTIVQTVPQTVIFIGSCPACRVGILEEDFTCLGLLLAIFFFPLGILCCLALRQRRCPNCGATFD